MKANLFHVSWIAPLVADRPAPVRRARPSEAFALLPLARRAEEPPRPARPARRLTKVWDEFNW